MTEWKRDFVRRLVTVAIFVLFVTLGGDELEHLSVHAESEAGGGRAVVEHVTEVSIAFSTKDFGADHVVGAVGLEPDAVAGDRFVERWPAGAAVELGVGGEEVEVAADAVIGSGALLVEVDATECGLGAFGAKNLVLLLGQLLLPFGVGENHLILALWAGVGNALDANILGKDKACADDSE